ncbi:hypothetical protein TSOC_014320 [Tetrabaena socialis]|uniref:Uncharacterized protein n=1 Tax=Tetrabaena socialis TaxID=47790 RepID=A0A2J7ZHZ5_9CHLO|nr:hypothetical protein TSOC_014320 [Tetrabaena socialis]|eukprot:PNG99893.1 hypothetical protein TSOC_014320 [Tetrabaena socialis]
MFPYPSTPAGPQADVAVYEEADEAFYVDIGKSRSERILYISAGSALTSETRFVWADQPEADFQLVLPRVQVAFEFAFLLKTLGMMQVPLAPGDEAAAAAGDGKEEAK